MAKFSKFKAAKDAAPNLRAADAMKAPAFPRVKTEDGSGKLGKAKKARRKPKKLKGGMAS